MRTIGIALLVGLCFPTLGTASPLIFAYSGESLTVDSETDGWYVLEGGSLNIVPGAKVSSSSTWDAKSSVKMSGGEVDHCIEIGKGSFDASGGTAFSNHSGLYTQDALSVDNGSARISGGTFAGVLGSAGTSSALSPSTGLIETTSFLSTVEISGGTFTSRVGVSDYYRTSYSLLSMGNTTVTGGRFSAPIVVNGEAGGTTEFLGSNLAYNATSHILSGVLQNGDRIDVPVYLFGGAGVKVDGDGTKILFSAAFPSPPTQTSPVPVPNPNPDPDPANGSNPVPDPASGSNPDPAPVPEPAAITIFGLMTVLGLARRRLRRAG